MKNPLHRLIAALAWVLPFLLLTCSCTKQDWEDRHQNNNIYLYFELEDTETLYVAYNRADFKKAIPTANGSLFTLDFEGDRKAYRIELSGVEEDYRLWFSGFDAIDNFHEQDWQRQGDTFILEGQNLQDPNGGYYIISLQEYP